MKHELDTLLASTIARCIRKGLLRDEKIPEYVIEVPNNPGHGHFATNLPLALASCQKRPPRDIAALIVDQMEDDAGVAEKVEIAGPGFINFTINASRWHRILSQIITLRGDYGRSTMGRGEKVLVEFVSANPTGPLHLGHGRGAALGDTLSRILSFCGYDVDREFYINDAGLQIRLLGESILSRHRQKKDPGYPFPENGYHGQYIAELADTVAGGADLDHMTDAEAVEHCSREGKAIMLAQLEADLSRFGVTFDLWYSESELFDSGLLQEALAEIEAKGHLYEEDGALWIKTSRFGDDKDRVIRKNDGYFTYFASDIAYHLQKRNRGVQKAINIWGADHHGYVPRMKAALTAHGLPEDWLSVLLIQLVKLWEGGKEIRMSKRAGNFVTLQELCDEVGVDAVRFVFLSKSHDSPLDFDIDLVKKQDSDNPVYYVQYAHARLCSIFRRAAEEGIVLPDDPGDSLGRLQLEPEMVMIRKMAEFPALLEDIAGALEPHRLTYYLTDLAASFHRYFNLGSKNPAHRIVTMDEELSRARLALAEGLRIVIATGLNLLGIQAPEQM